MPLSYTEHKGRVVSADDRFKHVMAITLDPSAGYKDGIARCITSRVGNVEVKGYVDRSVLHKIQGDSLEKFKISEKLKIKNEDEIISRLAGEDLDFIGLEDPDIFIDELGLMHLYFTMPFLVPNLIGVKKRALIYLGHAVGKNLDSLEMTDPVLMINEKTGGGAKEVSIAPLNKKGFRYNLVESGMTEEEGEMKYSIVQVVITKDMGKAWEYGEIAFHPKEHNIPWIAGHASPGPLLSKTFIDIGEGKMLGIINGREANKKIGTEIKYGIFSVGLFIYDYENGKIDWVSPEPLIRDSEAKTITFASCFVETGKGEGILYAHVDDSFVRAYTLKAESLKSIIPIKI